MIKYIKYVKYITMVYFCCGTGIQPSAADSDCGPFMIYKFLYFQCNDMFYFSVFR